MTNTKQRCPWAENDALMQAYHDEEWGVPLHDDRRLFEFLILEGAQAGLSWQTILRRRDGYRKAFLGFNAKRIAAMTPKDEARLLKDPGIIRNRLKIKSTIQNAKAFLAIQKECGSFDRYLWNFVNHKPIKRAAGNDRFLATTSESDALSKDLRQRGFNFVGSTICYAFMQATGMVNDHIHACFRF